VVNLVVMLWVRLLPAPAPWVVKGWVLAVVRLLEPALTPKERVLVSVVMPVRLPVRLVRLVAT
jgi:hypothetical protein